MAASRAAPRALGSRRAGGRRRPLCARASVSPPAVSAEHAAFLALAEAAGCDVLNGVELRRGGSGGGLGLFATRAIQRGTVLMTVPHACCLSACRDPGSGRTAGLNAPPGGTWPVLRAGLGAHGDVSELPWDVWVALMLVDARRGGGGELWEGYAGLLPLEEELTLPLCMPPSALAQLQDEEVASAAAAQQGRLRELFPSLSEPGASGVSALQWAFACVRSRAFALSADAFAFVPFLDMANHCDEPTCAFVQPEGEGGDVRLAARLDVKEGEELTISYFYGAAKYDTRRMLQQYGFVAGGGNPVDRLPLEVPEGGGGEGFALALEALEGAVPAGEWAAAVSGRDLFLFAALQSLPVRDVPHGPGAAAACESLRAQCERAEASFETSAAHDEGLLASGSLGGFEREAVCYRLAKKRLWAAAGRVLGMYAAATGADA